MASSSSSSSEDPSPPWLELPPEITAKILHKLGAVEILTTAQWVCPTWWRVCKDPSMWRSIDIPNASATRYNMHALSKHAVDRSQGELVDFKFGHFCSDHLLSYMSERCTQLKRFRLVGCNIDVFSEVVSVSGLGLSQAVKKFPLLEELHLFCIPIRPEVIEDIGFSCQNLKSFTLNIYHRLPHTDCDLEALAIAKSMPELRHLQFMGSKLTNSGLRAILEGCPRLESLDLRQCLNINLKGDFGALCSQKIKHLRLPNDSLRDYQKFYDYLILMEFKDLHLHLPSSDDGSDSEGTMSSISDYGSDLEGAISTISDDGRVTR